MFFLISIGKCTSLKFLLFFFIGWCFVKAADIAESFVCDSSVYYSLDVFLLLASRDCLHMCLCLYVCVFSLSDVNSL